MQQTSSWCRLGLVLFLVLVVGCGEDAKKEEDDSGGDHLPDDEVYDVAALPIGSESYGMVAREIRAPFLRRFVRFAERYDVCLSNDTLDDTAFAALQDRLARRAGAVAEFGLEGVINRALATVDRFKPGVAVSAGRIEIHLIRPEASSCHMVVTRAAETEFPFSHTDFSGKSQVALEVNRLRTPAGILNSAPVVFIHAPVTGADLLLAAELSISTMLGLTESSLAASKLNGASRAATPGLGYFLEQSPGTPRIDDDAQTLYGFALVYSDVIKTVELDAYYHYEDQVLTGDQDQDPDLAMPAQVTPVIFSETLGNHSLYGVRRIGDTLGICVVNSSGVVIEDERLQSYLDFISPDSPGSVISFLAAREPLVKTRAMLVNEGCGLVLALKNEGQYPFSEQHVNGLYAREGTLKTALGETTSLPVIYLNVSMLDLDPEAQGTGAKPIKLVLQHEFAHFLGFKHSTSRRSILSPAGYNAKWDEAGGDRVIFDAFMKAWRS